MPLLRVLAERIGKADARRGYRLAVYLGHLFQWLGVTRKIVRRNVELACHGMPPPDVLRRFEARYYRHMALLIVEFLRQPYVRRQDLPRVFLPDGLAEMLELYERGEGVIFVAGHAGVWEMAGHVAGLVGIDLLSVAKLSGHPLIDGWTCGIREAGGQTIRDVRGSLWTMKKTLDRKQAVGINVDQEARQSRVFAPFFGIPAATSNAPALLHLKTKAPIAVVTAHRVGVFRYRLQVCDVIRHAKTKDKQGDLVAITTRINAAMEQAMRAYPEQWLWSHRRWRRRPDDEAEPFARVDDTAPLELEPA